MREPLIGTEAPRDILVHVHDIDGLHDCDDIVPFTLGALALRDRSCSCSTDIGFKTPNNGEAN